MKKSKILLTLIVLFAMISCQKDIDLPSLDRTLKHNVEATETLLREKPWSFNDLKITVKNEMRAIPLLANVADENGMVQPGEYNSIEIFGNLRRQKFYHYRFTLNKVHRDTLGYGVYDEFAHYDVISGSKISLSYDSLTMITYDYTYDEDYAVFNMKSDQFTNGKINDAANKLISTAIRSGKADDISSAVVDKLLGNEEVQAAIQQALYDLIHNKLIGVAESPEKIAEVLARLVLQKLKEVDWEEIVYDQLVELLEELKVDNPELAAQELAEKIAQRIKSGISQSDIYDKIFPILSEFEDETLPELVPVLAETIYNLIANTFSGENIYEKIYPIWTEFAQLDSIAITELSDSLGSVFTNHFFNVDSIANSLVPFMETLRATPTHQIPALAQDIIDEVLIPKVDALNATFPGLELEPDWESIKSVLSSALTVIKSNLNGQTNEEAAAAMAESIIGIMDAVISNGVATALFYMQDIPADQASQLIAAWVYNLVLVAEPEITEFLETRLSELADLFNAEEKAEEISSLIYGKVLEVFGTENIYNLVLPIMEELSNINVEAAAQIITDWLFDMDLVGEGITEEQVLDVLTEIISQLIGNINVDEASQKLLDLILQSNIVENIDGDVLKQLLEIKTYELLIDLKKEINAVEKVELSIVRNFNVQVDE